MGHHKSGATFRLSFVVPAPPCKPRLFKLMISPQISKLHQASAVAVPGTQAVPGMAPTSPRGAPGVVGAGNTLTPDHGQFRMAIKQVLLQQYYIDINLRYVYFFVLKFEEIFI